MDWRPLWSSLFEVEPSTDTTLVMDRMAALCRGEEADVLLVLAMYQQVQIQTSAEAFGRMATAYGSSIERTIDAIIEKNDRIAAQLQAMERTMADVRTQARQTVESLAHLAWLADGSPVRGRRTAWQETQETAQAGSNMIYRLDLKLLHAAATLVLLVLLSVALLG